MRMTIAQSVLARRKNISRKLARYFLLKREFARHDKMQNEIDESTVEIGDENQANETSDHAKKFNFIVASNATSEIVCDLLMKFSNEGASNQADDTREEPAPTERPNCHELIVACFF